MLPVKTIYILRKLLIICLCSFLTLCCAGQSNSNSLDITANSTNFNLSGSGALETQQTIPQAITIAVDSKSNSYSLYVKGTNGISSTATPIPVSNLAIQLRSVKEINLSYNNPNTIILATTDQRIGAAAKNGATGYWYYDLILNPIGYNIAPGTYTFTVTFTMTQP